MLDSQKRRRQLRSLVWRSYEKIKYCNKCCSDFLNNLGPDFRGSPFFDGKNCYLGVMHAHTVLSPDFQPQPANETEFRNLLLLNSDQRFSIANGPFAAYKRAADLGKLDFLAITDHVHGPESGQAEYCSHEMPNGGYQLIMDSAAKINTDDTYKGRFLAIPGMEWSVISRGNHANVFFANHPVPQTIPNGDFRALFLNYLNRAGLEKDNPRLLMQLNHPNSNPVPKNYGRDNFSGANGLNDFVNSFKDTYLAIEHINNSKLGNANSAELNAHQDGNSLESYYRKYLNMGFRLAPIGDHDNHRSNWGRHTAARTGVWANGLTADEFVEAYRARRVYATEDNEMAVAFLTDDKWMGSLIGVPSAGELKKFKVFVNQDADTDSGQLQNEGPYLVELITDDAVGGPLPRIRNIIFDGQSVGSVYVKSGDTVEFQYRVRPGTYCYIHVTEKGGKDSGQTQADAWTAPFFFTNQ